MGRITLFLAPLLLSPFTTAAPSPSTAIAPTAKCTTELLSWIASQFFVGAFSNAKSDTSTPFTKLSPTAKISQNNELLASIDDSIFGNATDFYKPFRIQALDTVTCDVATLVLVTEHASKKGPAPAGKKPAVGIVSVRLRVGANELVTEVEILNALKGSHALWEVEKLPMKETADWSTRETTTLGGATKEARDKLIAVANSYAEGIQTGNSAAVMAAKQCPRIENGVQTTGSCASQMEMFKWPVTDRRWVADVEKGVVMGSFFFHYRQGKGIMNQRGIRSSNQSTGLWLHEYFKIKDEKIVDVWAAMQTLDWRYKDIWGTSS